MLTHRFREHLHVLPGNISVGMSMPAFVPCPMFAMFSAGQQSTIQAIYQMAAEQTRQQLQPRRIRRAEFSRN
ncbi:hypothetical protein [Tuwongella immobilis]|uniref:Uncharacterized protein n=1 Tax=Tuwongella immobilis TaxID=692036 RepID=A0A6C2YM37_9BACT|nr:hypothetical protein [Tuwongella immobilis]VIP02289.1 unnamed protein product [Tuwongella immobilis]VTS00953.1 unnamed protein product [Tuwongella immobilis]